MVASMPQEYTIILEWEPIVTVPQRFPRSRVPVQWGRACERGHLEVGMTGQTCGVWLDLAAWPQSGRAASMFVVPAGSTLGRKTQCRRCPRTTQSCPVGNTLGVLARRDKGQERTRGGTVEDCLPTRVENGVLSCDRSPGDDRTDPSTAYGRNYPNFTTLRREVNIVLIDIQNVPTEPS